MEQNHQGQVMQGIHARILSSEIMQDLPSDTKCCIENLTGQQENIFLQIPKIHCRAERTSLWLAEQRAQCTDTMVTLPPVRCFPYFTHVANNHMHAEINLSCSNALKSPCQPLKKDYMQVFSAFLHQTDTGKSELVISAQRVFSELCSSICRVHCFIEWKLLQSVLAPLYALGRWTCESSTSIKTLRMQTASWETG